MLELPKCYACEASHDVDAQRCEHCGADLADPPSLDRDEALESLDRYPADQAQESLEYQRLAWFSAPFGSAGVFLVVLLAAINAVKAVARAGLRVLLR